MNLLFLFKNISKIYLLLITQIISHVEFHEYYVSTTEVDYIKEKNLMQITIRIFIDDFEEIVKQKNNNLKVAPDSNSKKINEILNQYIFEKFKISVNDQELIYEFIGKEYKSDMIQAYYEAEINNIIKNISFENYILFDYFENQQNIIHYKNDKFRKSFLHTIKNPKFSLSLK